MKPVQVIGLTAYLTHEAIAHALNHIKELLEQHGLSFIVDDHTAAMMPGMIGCPLDEFLDRADMIISLGGDGTFLHRAALVAKSGKPIAGINLGRLGFMTAGSVTEVEELIDAVISREYILDSRTLLSVSLIGSRELEDEEPVLDHYYALNEIAILRSKTGRMVDLESFVDGNFLTHYHADGLLVATPSGSTAYSLSAGGPVISPESRVLCLTPICPHSLMNRSLVLSDNVIIDIRSRKKKEAGYELVFSIDGDEVSTLRDDMRLSIKVSPDPVKIVRLPGYKFTDLLRKKIRWGGSEV